jgi:hypothetical protein
MTTRGGDFGGRLRGSLPDLGPAGSRLTVTSGAVCPMAVIHAVATLAA